MPPETAKKARIEVDGEKMDPDSEIGDADLEDGDQVDIVGLEHWSRCFKDFRVFVSPIFSEEFIFQIGLFSIEILCNFFGVSLMVRDHSED